MAPFKQLILPELEKRIPEALFPGFFYPIKIIVWQMVIFLILGLLK